MNKSPKSHVPITDTQLAEQLPVAAGILAEVIPVPKSEFPTGGTSPKMPSLRQAIFELGGKTIPMTETANLALLAMQTGIQVGLHLAGEYSRLTSLKELQARNGAGQLGGREAEFSRLNTNAAAIAVFGAASYALWRLGKHREDDVRAVTVQEFPKADLNLVERVSALKSLAWHIAAVASQSGTELHLVKAMLQELEAVAKDIIGRVPNLEGIATFETVAYQLAGTSFIVDGFEIATSGSGVSSEFRKVSLDAIVGNAEAKLAAMRTAYRLALYDPKLRKNPLSALGAMPFVRMGFGVPGTGKSLQICGTATLMEDLCARRGIPFIFAPMPNTVISTFQGGSAERGEAWIRQHRNPGAIVYLVIDDGESNLEDRSRQGVSAGVREVIGVVLRETEGASAVPLGNAILDIYTNLPEQLDPAILSRVRERFELKGAQGLHDIADQMHLWWKGYRDLFPEELKDLTALDGYTLMGDQRMVLGGGAAGKQKPRERYLEPQHELTKRALVAARKRSKHPLSLVPGLFAEFQLLVPSFSSRDVRNVSENAGTRFLDFEIPGTWFDSPAEFFDRSWDDRVGLLRELSRQCCQGLALHEVLLEEALRYLDVRAQISNLQFERDVREAVHRGKVIHAAEAQLLESGVR